MIASSDQREMAPAWMKYVLRAAGLYNLVWGLVVVVYPSWMFDLFSMEVPTYLPIWQCLGMVVGVYGIGYFIAASNPVRHWPIVLVGLIGKVLGPIGFLWAVWAGHLPKPMGWTIITNDLIWWIPFAGILWHAFGQNMLPEPTAGPQRDPMTDYLSDKGNSLPEMSRERPTLVVFLRHAGCTFHREALADLRGQRPEIERLGFQLALVHMAAGENPAESCDSYGLCDVDHFSNPDQTLYWHFGLKRGKFMQLLGPQLWWRGFRSMIIDRNGLGRIVGDGLQMPGVFLIRDGRILSHVRHETACDRPNYIEFVQKAAGQINRTEATAVGPSRWDRS